MNNKVRFQLDTIRNAAWIFALAVVSFTCSAQSEHVDSVNSNKLNTILSNWNESVSPNGVVSTVSPAISRWNFFLRKNYRGF